MDAECRDVVALVLDIYRQFGFEDVRIKLSTRPENRMGDDASWDLLEGALEQSLTGMGLAYELNPVKGLSTALNWSLCYATPLAATGSAERFRWI